MADTSKLLEVEQFVRENCLQQSFGQNFTKRDMPLGWKTGGMFEVDAVSEDGTIAACITTSASSGKPKPGQIRKICTDALFMLNLRDVKTRLLAFTDKAMHDHFVKEQDKGRFPDTIDLLHCPLNPAQQQIVDSVHGKAVKEMTQP